MSTHKQRSRKSKEQRHAYDLVEIDSEGNETVVSATEIREAEPKREQRGAKPARKKSGRAAAQPPSWNRVAKRAALFGPLFLAVVYLLGNGKVTIADALLNTLLLLVVFVPFSYLMDKMVWRSYVKRNPDAAKS